MELFLLVIRSEVIIVSRVSERNNDYVASDRSEVSEHVNASFTQQEHQYKQQPAKGLLFLFITEFGCYVFENAYFGKFYELVWIRIR